MVKNVNGPLKILPSPIQEEQAIKFNNREEKALSQ